MKQRINANWYLQFIRLEFKDHTAILTIHERTPVAYTDVRGIYYILDSQGRVLGEYTEASGLTDLVLVDKLSVSSCIPGQTIVFANSATLNVYKWLMW